MQQSPEEQKSGAEVQLLENSSHLKIEQVLSGPQQQQQSKKEDQGYQVISDEQLQYVLEQVDTDDVKEQDPFASEQQQQEEADESHLQFISVEPEDISAEQQQTEEEETHADFSLEIPHLDFENGNYHLSDLIGDPIRDEFLNGENLENENDQNSSEQIATSCHQTRLQPQQEEVVAVKAETSQEALWDELFELI